MDLSLDEIIKKNTIGRNSQNSRGRKRNAGVRGNNIHNKGGNRNNLPRPNRGVNKTVGQANNGRINNPAQKQSGGNVVDARMLIIKKNRMRFTDARDKLATLAKQTDLRTKLKLAKHPDARNKIKGRNSNQGQRLNRSPPARTNYRDNKMSVPVLLQRSILNNVTGPTDWKGRVDNFIKCTINRNEEFEAEEYQDAVYPEEEYEDDDMSISALAHNSKIQVVTQNDYHHYTPSYISNEPEPMFVDYQPYTRGQPIEPLRQPLSLSRSGMRMSQQMRARLDTPPKSAHFSYTSTLPSQPPPSSTQGYRIVVSNLHYSVTHEDIKELFEDIGPLLTSRLVRPGTAEVIYKFQKDAKKAVEAYHNRQLDKQPMKCLLVTSRGAPAGSSGVLRSNNLPAPPKYPTSSKTSVMPDISAIHKALFANK